MEVSKHLDLSDGLKKTLCQVRNKLIWVVAMEYGNEKKQRDHWI